MAGIIIARVCDARGELWLRLNEMQSHLFNLSRQGKKRKGLLGTNKPDRGRERGERNGGGLDRFWKHSGLWHLRWYTTNKQKKPGRLFVCVCVCSGGGEGGGGGGVRGGDMRLGGQGMGRAPGGESGYFPGAAVALKET